MVVYKLKLINKLQFTLRAGDVISTGKDEYGNIYGPYILAIPQHPNNPFSKRVKRYYAHWFVESLTKESIERIAA